ncbi:MAG: L-histidine N(alpha)-methyltransferase [Rhizobacter sp.]|nr:L-histidine N(alpha)-methyltransferase [Burkholderiales bacterium]
MFAHCSADGIGLLTGIDARKDYPRRDAACNDALAVTPASNLNMPINVNRVLSTHFDVRDWQHRGFYNAGMVARRTPAFRRVLRRRLTAKPGRAGCFSLREPGSINKASLS